MKVTSLIRGCLVGALALSFLAVAAPASAQMGSLKGRVVNEKGEPVPDAEVVFDFVGDVNRQFKGKTDKKGEYIRAGLIVVSGRWRVTASKDGLSGKSNDMEVGMGGVQTVPDIVLKAGGATPGKAAPAGLTKEEIDKRNKKQAELEKTFNEANAAIAAGNFDEAIAKITAITADVPKCAACFIAIGDANLKKKDLASAEKAFLQAIEFDPAGVDPYNALATIYNEQKKFDEATKMSTKASELQAASGAAGDPTAIFNQGIIFWNQSKIPEAKAQFEKAVQLNPKMADAQYWLGMSYVNEGKLPEAKKPFEEYMKLAPTGQYADTAKAMLAMIK